jgi:hypothetical protein
LGSGDVVAIVSALAAATLLVSSKLPKRANRNPALQVIFGLRINRLACFIGVPLVEQIVNRARLLTEQSQEKRTSSRTEAKSLQFSCTDLRLAAALREFTYNKIVCQSFCSFLFTYLSEGNFLAIQFVHNSIQSVLRDFDPADLDLHRSGKS